MIPPLAALSLLVAGGLALFAVALALPRPAHPPARRPLLAVLIALAVLVLRGGLLRIGLWPSGALELALALSLFVAIPMLLVVVVRSATRSHTLPTSLRSTGLLIPGGIGLSVFLAGRGENGLAATEWRAFVLVLHAVSLGCIAIILRLRASPARPSWLDPVLSLFAVHWAFSSASWTVGAFQVGSNGLATVLEVGSLLTLLAFGAVAVVRALRSLPALQPQVTPYARSGLDDALCQQRADVLRDTMEADRPYLDPELSAADLADALGLTPRELSQILNVEIGRGFFEFVNAYRVEEAKRQLASADHADDTILEILYRSGFNSKSAFHRAFKANVGMTPSAYRRETCDAFRAKAA